MNTLFKGAGIYETSTGTDVEAGLSEAGKDEEGYSTYYSYDVRNRLEQVQSGGTDARYTYDPTGRRQSKTVNGITTVHRWDGSNIAGESVGNTNYTYYRGVNIIAQSDGSTTGYYHYNGHGDTTRITSASGEVLASYDYDAFGNETGTSGNIYNPFRYNGQYSDEETGLIYLRARYYDPSAGRFITEDPAKDGVNWYSYCAGNPVNFVDPMGLSYKKSYDIEDIIKYCSNSSDLDEHQRYLISSALNAYHDGVISKETALDDVASNGGVIREDQKLEWREASMKGNQLTINLYVTYESNLVGEKMKGTDYTYDELATAGFSECWSGTVDGITIKTYVYVDSPSHKSTIVEINEGDRQESKNEDRRLKDTPILLYYNNSDLITPKPQNFKNIAGHEMGHKAFNLNDNVTNGRHKTVNGHGVSGISGLMIDNSNTTTLDLAMLLYSYSQGFKKWVFYSDHPNLLNKYAPGWYHQKVYTKEELDALGKEK